jgi:hypothetical protein
MIINASFDPSVASAPPSYKDGVASAIQILEANFGSNITINVHFGWGELDGSAVPDGAAGTNISNGAFYTYDQVRNALTAAATSVTDFQSLASLTATDPTNGGQFWLTDAQAATLKLATPASIDAYVGLNSSLAYTFDPNHRGEAGRYDGIGVIEHEITEIMGRLGWLGSYFDSNAQNIWAPLDLFRYSAPGVRDQTGSGSFSADGGVTLLTKFNDPSTTAGDVSDWVPTLQGDSFGTTYQGTVGMMTATDLKVMDVLGYTLTNFNGTPQDDSFSGTAYNETFNGGTGVDTLTFRGPHTSYVISGTYPTLTVTDTQTGRDGTDTLNSIELLKFTDIGLVFGLTSAQDQLVYRLYQAAFARMPDFAGFKTWATMADASHASALDLAQTFTASAEFAAKYAAGTDAAYIGALYANVLGRPGDDAGVAYWLSKGETRAQLLVDFATSAENVALTGSHMANGYWVA